MVWLINFVVAAVIVLSVAVLFQVGQVAGWVSSEAASWVQAITSFMAILASGYLAVLIPAMERRRQQLLKLIGYRNLASIAVDYVNDVAINNEPGIETWRYRRRQEICMKAVEIFPNGEIQPPSLIRHFAEIRIHCDRFWGEYTQPRPDLAEMQETVLRRSKESREELNLRLAQIDGVLKNLGTRFVDNVAYAPHEGVPPPPTVAHLKR